VQNNLRVGGLQRVHHDVSQGSAPADVTMPSGTGGAASTAGTPAGGKTSGGDRQSS
jgi:hypothetical protein